LVLPLDPFPLLDTSSSSTLDTVLVLGNVVEAGPGTEVIGGPGAGLCLSLRGQVVLLVAASLQLEQGEEMNFPTILYSRQTTSCLI